MSRILLVAPRFDSEFSRAFEISKYGRQMDVPRSLMIPLHLATIAALTPDEFEVDIWDEGDRGEIQDDTELDKQYDLVGITAYMAHVPRAVELSHVFHHRGTAVAVGGPGVSGVPELCRDVFDVTFIGEAELTWPRFLREWKKGHHLREYRQVERLDLSRSPAPRWDSIAANIPRYRLAAVQTTRGCPFDCEFCDVIHLFGRRPRHKPIDQVIEEIVTLQKLGAQRAFVCDDNFIGDRKYTKELLRELIPVNNGFKAPMSFSTQLSIDLSQDDELMELMADCNFVQACIGIESPRAASLKEANKTQNLHRDLVADCKKIQSYGIAIKGSLIVGFDSDDSNIFEEQMQFLDEANITVTSINLMKAMPGTPLWIRLQQQERVIDVSDTYIESPKVVSNVIPKNMTHVELLEGYLRLLEHARSWDSFKERIMRFISSIKRPPNVPAADPAVRRERMAKAKEFLDTINEEVRQPVMEIIGHAMQTVPFLMERIGALMLQQFMDYNVLPHQRELIQRQIEQVRDGKIKINRDPSAGMIPKNFSTAIRDVIPEIYARLADEIEYKPGVTAALAALFRDFLIRWGKDFKQFEDYHHAYLKELCDRHIERRNRKATEAPEQQNETGGDDGDFTPLTPEKVKAMPFITDLLVAVEQELRGETCSKP